jgi:putative component of membrane protein insertase Oxa1/YidC/SpoIIIJ protein YidD
MLIDFANFTPGLSSAGWWGAVVVSIRIARCHTFSAHYSAPVAHNRCSA